MVNEKNNYLNLHGLSLFLEKLKQYFSTKEDLEDIKVDNTSMIAVANTSSNGLMSKDMVVRLNLCTSELVQSEEPAIQEEGDSWLQEYM